MGCEMEKIEQGKRLLSSVEAARHLGVSVATLGRWRTEGTGPRYLRIPMGRSRVRYHVEDLDRWVREGSEVVESGRR